MRLLLLAPLAAAFAVHAATTAERCNELLHNALNATNPDTRKQAVLALSLASDRGPLFDQLEAMLKDKDVEVRQSTVATLAGVKTARSTAALRTALEDPVPEVSFAAAKALWARHDKDGRSALLAVLEGEAKTTSNFFSKQKRDALRMMHTPRTTFLFAIQQGFGFIPFPGVGEGVASMQGILSDSGVSGRASAALLLAADKTPATLDALKDALSDKNASVRAAAVHAISLRNEPAFKPDLERLLDDGNESVRLRAAAGYLRLASIESTRTQRRIAPAAPPKAPAAVPPKSPTPPSPAK